ncbi:hypothetical protein GcM3_108021, partial [Golovinomyces cichoracearum]
YWSNLNSIFSESTSLQPEILQHYDSNTSQSPESQGTQTPAPRQSNSSDQNEYPATTQYHSTIDRQPETPDPQPSAPRHHSPENQREHQLADIRSSSSNADPHSESFDFQTVPSSPVSGHIPSLSTDLQVFEPSHSFADQREISAKETSDD